MDCILYNAFTDPMTTKALYILPHIHPFTHWQCVVTGSVKAASPMQGAIQLVGSSLHGHLNTWSGGIEDWTTNLPVCRLTWANADHLHTQTICDLHIRSISFQSSYVNAFPGSSALPCLCPTTTVFQRQLIDHNRSHLTFRLKRLYLLLCIKHRKLKRPVIDSFKGPHLMIMWV